MPWTLLIRFLCTFCILAEVSAIAEDSGNDLNESRIVHPTAEQLRNYWMTVEGVPPTIEQEVKAESFLERHPIPPPTDIRGREKTVEKFFKEAVGHRPDGREIGETLSYIDLQDRLRENKERASKDDGTSGSGATDDRSQSANGVDGSGPVTEIFNNGVGPLGFSQFGAGGAPGPTNGAGTTQSGPPGDPTVAPLADATGGYDEVHGPNPVAPAVKPGPAPAPRDGTRGEGLEAARQALQEKVRDGTLSQGAADEILKQIAPLIDQIGSGNLDEKQAAKLAGEALASAPLTEARAAPFEYNQGEAWRQDRRYHDWRRAARL